MGFYQIYEQLCCEKGVTPTQAAREANIPQSSASMWKKRDSTPNADALIKLSDYFHVSVNYLIGNTIGQRIEKARIKRGMTLEEMGQRLGVSEALVNEWEKGLRIPDYKVLQRIGSILNWNWIDFVPEKNVYKDQEVLPDVREVFIERMLAEIENAGSADVEAAGIDTESYKRLAEHRDRLTLQRARDIADELGVTLDYLVGRTDDSHTKPIGIGAYSELSMKVEDAEEDLMQTVHDICGMDEWRVAENVAAGNVAEVWNPGKIRIVREYLEDSRTILQKMMATLPAQESGEGQK